MGAAYAIPKKIISNQPIHNQSSFKRGLGFPAKISLMIGFILAFGIGINLFLSYFNFEKNYLELVQSRFAVVATDLKNTIETGLNLGLELRELKHVQTLVDEIGANQQDLSLISVFADNEILFSSNRGLVGTQVPAAWLNSLADSRVGQWQYEDGLDFVFGVSLRNSFHKRVGTLMIGYPTTLVDVVSREVLTYLLWVFVAVLLSVTLVVAALVYLTSRKTMRSFRRMEQALVDADGSIADTHGKGVASGELEESYLAFQDNYLQLKSRLTDLHCRVDQQLENGNLSSSEADTGELVAAEPGQALMTSAMNTSGINS